ncbi:MAG: TIGR03086 family metal-binding protein [Nocardioidaceae bacterium]
MLDLEPAAQQLARLLDNLRDDQLAGPTPCPDYTLGTLVDHVDGLSRAFTEAATKDLTAMAGQAPAPDGSRLDDTWRARVPTQLSALAEAWRDPAAWEGMTRAGGVDLPGAAAGQVALDELVIHGWDIARASGQDFTCDPAALDATMEFVSAMSAPGVSREGLFGPVVDVPPDAPLLDRMIGLSGRDPGWRPDQAR